MISSERNEGMKDMDGQTAEQQSPSDKLSDTQTEASPLPGAQNPASTEIKRETNFNTE